MPEVGEGKPVLRKDVKRIYDGENNIPPMFVLNWDDGAISLSQGVGNVFGELVIPKDSVYRLLTVLKEWGYE